MNMKPLLTVVMPTHNRSEYAKHAITSVLSITSPDLQLVVHDTSDGVELEEFILSRMYDERLKYIRHSTRLSMTENHNAAMGAADGEYVCLIGDDDTIMPEAMEAVAWASSQGIDALSPIVVAYYSWPDFRSLFFGKGHASRVYISKQFGSVRRRDTQTSLVKALGAAAQGSKFLPRVYHGFVRRRVMEELRLKSGAYFHGSSPDVSGAIGVAMMLPFYVEVDYPLTLPGASGKSNSGRSAMNKHKGKLSNDGQTAEFADRGWPTEIPRFFSVETVWAHAAVDTVRRIDEMRLKEFNFIYLYGLCWFLHKEYRQEVLESFRNEVWRKWREVKFPWVALILEITRIAATKLMYTAKRALRPTAAGNRHFIPDAPTINAAQTELISYLKKTGMSISKILGN